MNKWFKTSERRPLNSNPVLVSWFDVLESGIAVRKYAVASYFSGWTLADNNNTPMDKEPESWAEFNTAPDVQFDWQFLFMRNEGFDVPEGTIRSERKPTQLDATEPNLFWLWHEEYKDIHYYRFYMSMPKEYIYSYKCRVCFQGEEK